MLKSTASLLLLVANGVLAATPAPPPSTAIYPAVSIDGNAMNGVFRIDQLGKKLCIAAAVEKAWGFKSPAAQCLDDIAGVSYKYSEQQQTLDIMVPAALLDWPATVLNGRQSHKTSAKPSIAPGLAIGYDVLTTTAGSYTLETSPTLGTKWGVLTSNFLTTNGQTTRLNTTFTHYWPQDDLELSLGDVNSGSTNWSRGLRLGGIQIRKDYSMSPDFITFPIPAFYGTAALPSTVELFVDSEKMYTGKVPGGAFTLLGAPAISGAGTAYFAVQNALGIVQTASVPFYTSPALLRPGLWSFDISAGYPDYGFGRSSFDYGNTPALNATVSRGITDHLTLQGHIEASSGLTLGGLGVIYQPGLWGTIHAAAASSGSGSLADLGYDYAGRSWSFSWDSQRTFGDYRDSASLGPGGQLPPRKQDQLHLGYHNDWGQFSVGYVGLQYVGEPESRFATLGYSRSFFGGYLSLSANRDLNRRSNLFTLSYSRPFGKSSSADVSYDSERQATLRIQNSQQPWGYLANLNISPGYQYGQLEADYRGPHFWAVGGIQGTPQNPYGYLEVQGTVVVEHHDVFAGGPLFGSPYAVVNTIAGGVPVSYENRPVGKSDSKGYLLVPQLVPWISNKFAISVMDLPADLDTGATETTVVPEPGAGVDVNFSVKQSTAATITLTHDGKLVETGSTITVDGATSEVGYAGMAYLKDLKPHNTAVVSLVGGGSCKASFDWKVGQRVVKADCR